VHLALRVPAAGDVPLLPACGRGACIIDAVGASLPSCQPRPAAAQAAVKASKISAGEWCRLQRSAADVIGNSAADTG
jgi:hypothetical protein